MTGGRGWAARAGLALLAAATLALAGTSVAEAADPLKLNIQVGYGNGNLIKPSQWMPVTVDITNLGQSFDGTLEIQNVSGTNRPGPPGGVAVYEMPVSLATGATKRFRTYVMQDFPGSLEVRVMRGGQMVISTSAQTTTSAGLLVGVLSDQQATLDELSAVRPGGFTPNVTHLQGADLPDSSLILRSFDMLAIDDFSTDTLTAAQRNALSDYVVNGGALFLGTGGSWRKTLGGLPAAMLPMQVTGSALLPSVKALNGLTGLEVATGSTSAGNVWLSEGQQPLLLEKRFGQGMVSMATFDWNQTRLASFNSSTTLLRQAFVRATYGVGVNPSGPPGMVTKFGFSTSLASKGGQLSQALSNLPALSLPAWWVIGSLVLIYVLLVGPINYFVLRVLNRRALAWVTVPVLALVGSAGAYGAGVITKGTSVQANQISVVHVQPGWERAYQEVYTGVLTPTRGDYEVGIVGSHPLISPIYNYVTYGIVNANQPSVRINTATDGISLPGMTAFIQRGFATEGISNAPRVQASAELVSGSFVGTIQNLSPIHFTDGVVFTGSSFQKLTKLDPNGSLSFSVSAGMVTPFTGQPIFMQIYPNLYGYGCCGPQQSSLTDAQRDIQLKSTVLSTLPGASFNGSANSSTPTVVLWTKEPFQGITVNGSRPHSRTQGAVVMTLPITRIGAGTLPLGVVTGRMVDLDATIQSQVGPPGVFVTQPGSVTYDFQPVLAPGLHLTSTSISSANMFGAKVVPASTTGSPPTVHGQVWDWTQAAWIDVRYAESGSTAVPDGAVNPNTGEVLLKLSSDSPFSSGYLSLVGGVQ